MEKQQDTSHTPEELGKNLNREDFSMKDNKELFKRKTLTTNGIMVIGNDERGYFAAIGNSRISEVYETYQEVEEKVADKDWEILGAYVAVMIEGYNRLEREKFLGKPEFEPIEGKYDISKEEFNNPDQLKMNLE